jgi:ABC-type multidrug transport system ATPase subunit/AcrR family transcriptional regulator
MMGMALSSDRRPSAAIPGSSLRQEKREIILDAAIKVFAQTGYHGARVSDIAREAGIAYGLVYHYFKNKEEILHSIFEERWSGFLEAVETIADSPTSTEDRLFAVASLILNAYRVRPDWVKVLVVEIQRSSRVTEPAQIRAMGRLFQLIARILRRGQEAGEIRKDLDPEPRAAGREDRGRGSRDRGVLQPGRTHGGGDLHERNDEFEACHVIEADGITKRYGDLVAVDGVSFQIGQGEVVGFLGANGAGKTTTMRILTGYIPATDGTARIAGHDIFSEPLAARRAIGYLPESPPLYPEMDVAGYLRYVAALRDVPRGKRRAAVERALERCGLTAVSRRVIGQLSKGYRQRVGIAQAIVHDPPVLILDEPTVGLDPLQIREIRGLLRELAAPEAGGAQHTIVLSTHVLAEVEAICKRVILIHEGRKEVDAPLEELVAGGKRLEELFTQVTARDLAASDELQAGEGGS